MQAPRPGFAGFMDLTALPGLTAAHTSVAESPAPPGPGCEALAPGLLGEPVSAVTSLAFVVAGAWIVARAQGRRSRPGTAQDAREETHSGQVLGYALLVAGIGVGSVLQHGPDPAWSDVAHDLPLVATVAFVGADSLADVLGRVRRWWWWALPTVGLLPLIVAAPRAGDLAQVAVAIVAVALTLLRALSRPATRGRIAAALGLLVVGATVGTLSRPGGVLCDPDSLWQGHAAWHVLAAVALVVLAPLVERQDHRAHASRTD